ncbi:MAG TPA: gamma-glutamylcyclotransferase family protein [Candidatus Limnocylindria bacterium]|nr:gamma-glutamylcyclotransferase family protein [Candidatus Limnocylindria bacterium]
MDHEVFFYGLFMDVARLRAKGLHPDRPRVGWVDDTRLIIGARAALVPETGARTYGVVASLPVDEVRDLYTEESLRDYVPEPVVVRFDDGSSQTAVCYNVPRDKAGTPDLAYVARLRDAARRAGLPDDYVAAI